MSRMRSQQSPARRALLLERPIRLDVLANPYGPSVYVQEALSATDELHLPVGDRELLLHIRLANLLGVAPNSLLLGNGATDIVDALLLRQMARGPLLVFPPTDPAVARRAEQFRIEVQEFRRAGWFGLDLGVEDAPRVAPGTLAHVLHPNDPSGTLLGSQTLVRLARWCDLVVVDERHLGYGGRTFTPLVREFDNIAVLQTYENWAGLAGTPFAYLIAPPGVVRELRPLLRDGGVAMSGVLAAQATLDDYEYVRATASRVREERSRLYRTLRKLNIVRPTPSAANFVLAHVERGSAEQIVRELAERDIRVHKPTGELGDSMRVSAVNPDGTDALKRALIDIAAWI